MKMKILNNSIPMGFLKAISGLWTKDAQIMDADTSRGSSFHGRELGWARCQSCWKGNWVFLALRQELLFLFGILKREKGKENFRSVVRKSMSLEKVLKTTKKRRARQYIYLHTSRFGKIWTNNNMIGWMPKLPQKRITQVPVYFALPKFLSVSCLLLFILVSNDVTKPSSNP